MMLPVPRSRLLAPLFFAALLAFGPPAAPLAAQPDRNYDVPPSLTFEIRTLIRLLEEAHYNRETVKPKDYSAVLPNYMGDLDGQRLFFLQSDLDHFTGRYGDGLYWNIATLGRIDPAFTVFKIYEQRTAERIGWVLNRLDGDFDLEAQGSYTTDRKTVPWPANPAAADALWEQRLKFDLLQELLNEKDLPAAKERVRKRYERMLKNVADIENDEISELFLANVAKLYDPHSTYFSASTFEDFGIQMRLQLVGIGALLGLEDDYCVVREVIAGGPASIDGRIAPNDRILAVGQGDEEPVDIIGMKLRRIVDMIRGEKGTPVKLLIRPGDAADPSTRKEIILTRDVVNLDSARARGAIFEVPNDAGSTRPLGVISLPAFYGPDASAAGPQNSATDDVKELIRRMQEVGIDGLVLDLRNNGGGLLTEAIDLTGLFISRGPVVQVRSYYGAVKVDSDEDPAIAYAGPLAVMVSKFSASASEIVAGALQNYGRAVVVGDSHTHGKGTVQTVIEMKNLIQPLARSDTPTGATKLTIQKFYLPNGSSTQLEGVVPDIILPSHEDLLPVGERDLPNALVWDEIPTSFFDGTPLNARILEPLRAASLARRAELEEFVYLTESIDWFRDLRDRKTISLNLTERLAQREADKAFEARMDEELERLQAANYAFTEFNLGSPKDEDAPRPVQYDDEGEPIELDTEEGPEGYARLDIQLRETLRVLNDAVTIGQDRSVWIGGHAPLTVATAETGLARHRQAAEKL